MSAKSGKSGFEALGGLVFSTDKGRTCPDCRMPVDECSCSDDSEITGSGRVRIWLDRKGRKGKGVTVIKELAMTADELKQLAKDLKKLCGTGGAVKQGDVEIQGDQREKILAELKRRGIDARLAGG